MDFILTLNLTRNVVFTAFFGHKFALQVGFGHKMYEWIFLGAVGSIESATKSGIHFASK